MCVSSRHLLGLSRFTQPASNVWHRVYNVLRCPKCLWVTKWCTKKPIQWGRRNDGHIVIGLPPPVFFFFRFSYDVHILTFSNRFLKTLLSYHWQSTNFIYWKCAILVSFDTCICLWNYHHNPDDEYVCPSKVSLCLFIIPSTQWTLSPSNNPFVFCHCRFFTFFV